MRSIITIIFDWSFLLFVVCMGRMRIIFNVVWESMANIPTNTMEMMSRRTSLFRMCVSSCAITASSSSSSSLSIIPCDRLMVYVLLFIPLA